MEQNWNGSTSANTYQYELFHYFGDPAMKIWTENPNDNAITATHSATIDCSGTSFSISNSEPGATATLVYNDDIIGVVTLNGSGNGSIPYAITTTGTEVILTISKTTHRLQLSLTRCMIAHLQETDPPHFYFFISHKP